MTQKKGRWIPPLSGRGKIGGWIVWTLWAIGAAAILWLRGTDALGDNAMNFTISYVVMMLMATIWLLWFLLGSGQRWWVRLVPIAAVAVLATAFFQFYRLEEFSGEFFPRFVPKSAAKPDTVLAAARGAGGQIDLTQTTPNDFPQFLGPDRNLRITNVALGRDWSTAPEALWRQPIGAGWSGFAVVGGYAATQEQRGDEELVTLYDVETGKLLWSHATQARYEVAMAGTGPRATPAIDEGIVYSQGATGRLLALDGATGSVIWEKDMLAEFGMTAEQEAAELPYGRSGSPLIVDDMLIIPAGGPKSGRQVSLVAYHKKTGEKIWEGGDEQMSCASPNIATLGGVRQILSVNESSATGHDPATGDVLWRHEREGSTSSNANVSQAVAVPPNRVFLSKGYALGATLIELVPKGDGTFDTKEIWKNSRVMRTKFTNVAVKDGYVYGLSDGILECIEMATGERQWKGGRYKHGQILLVGDLLVVLAESGEVVLVEATPERKNNVLGKFQAIEGKTWNNFALSGSKLLVRNGQEAACYPLPLA